MIIYFGGMLPSNLDGVQYCGGYHQHCERVFMWGWGICIPSSSRTVKDFCYCGGIIKCCRGHHQSSVIQYNGCSST